MMVLEGREVPSIFPEAKRAGEGFESEIIWSDVGYGIVPIGGIVAWCKTLVFGTSAELLIPNFLECNGQVVADGGSPLDGMALPDLNTTNRFLRGDIASGAIGGVSESTTTVRQNGGGGNYDCFDASVGENNIPPFYKVVWVIRIK